MISALVVSLVLTQAAPQKLRWEPRADLPVTGALVTGWLLSEFAFKKQLAPAACRWCETNAFDTAVRSVFNPNLVPSAEGFGGAHVASNLVGFVTLPVVMVGLDALLSWRDGVFLEAFPVDLVLVLEATFSALALNQAVKFAVGRGRPYTVGASAELLAGGHDLADNNLSFFSGHSTFSFGLVAATATVASLRNYRHAWVVWAVGLPLAAATATLRLAADKHWMSDVLVGTTLGVATGILMPTLLHGRLGPVTARVSPTGNGVAISGRF
ncbi:MAG: phosphatase PAP2 family protein [Myxococcota bacterium]